ncbi:Uncharacterised protein (plasmid) [Tsukamurella tyrosinosolvens]|uniref:Uncharacterized protein n=1 Tax=Tsukamurella tyrosinosolvens TaxID=57704 RepID=A0A1H4I6H6_TSUTY|nr:hypothetical protein [Tsukamurella tyrosinosolvens]KXO92758.1 hypothetical protein AXK58_19370 [Tsukamurella tyrosinosolvens]SEB29495.1 hypothetical protein SAMN04489793_0026 [Tsukamurella tyrosinosolvens]VEH95906.1 Uncharacterised protein [Tsukamurella tyrosinosolvens]
MNKNVLIGAVVVVLLVGGIALFRDDSEPAPRAAVSVPTTTPAWTTSAMPTTTTTTSTITPTSTSSAASSTAAEGKAETKELCNEIGTADDRRIPVTDQLYDHLHGTDGWTWTSVKPHASAAATALDSESSALLDTVRRSNAPSVITSVARDYADGLGDWATSIRSDLAARNSEGFTRTNALKPHLRDLAAAVVDQCKMDGK